MKTLTSTLATELLSGNVGGTPLCHASGASHPSTLIEGLSIESILRALLLAMARITRRLGAVGIYLLFAFASVAAVSSANGQTAETYGVAEDGTPLHWDVYTPDGTGPWPAMLVIHGGGFSSGDENTPGLVTAAEDLRAAGYLALAIEYRLAPPGLISAQTSDGRYPAQTNDCKLAVLAARADPRCSGQVGALGGSAGATHSAYLAADGVTGQDKVDVAVGLSGAYNFADPPSLAWPSGFKSKVENYCFVGAPPAEPEYSATLLANSVVSKVTSSVSPMM